MSSRILTRIAAYTAAGLLGAGLVVVVGGTRPLAPATDNLGYAAEAELASAFDAIAAEDPQPDSRAKPDRRGQRGKFAERLGRGNRFGLRGRVVHGEFVVRTKDGFKTAFVHKGEVTAVSATSITIKSADGFTKAYAVTDETKVRSKGKVGAISDVEVGEVALVGGIRDGETYTARLVAHRAKQPD